MANKYLKAENGPGNAVIYYDESGKLWPFEGGTRTWRNQNPGNLVVGKYSRNNKMIGKAGGFALFFQIIALDIRHCLICLSMSMAILILLN